MYHVRRFKVIIAIYLIVVVLLCVFVPCNVTLKGEARKNPVEIQYGLKYVLLTEMGTKEINEIMSIPGVSGLPTVKGTTTSKFDVSVLKMEFIVLSILFAGISYIICRKEQE